MLLKLKGNALTFALNNDTIKNATEINTVLKELKNQFVQKKLPSLALQEMMSGQKQRDDESPRAFGQRIQVLLNQSIPENASSADISVLNQCAKISYIQGISNPRVKRFVLSSNPEDFLAAITRTDQEYQNLDMFETPEPPSVALVNAKLRDLETRYNDIMLNSHNNNQMNSTHSEQRSVPCFSCGSYNHYTKFCEFNPRNEAYWLSLIHI